MTIRRSTDMRNKLLGTDDFKSRFDFGWLHIFSGSQPASPDSAEPGSLLMEVSEQKPATYKSATEFTVAGSDDTIYAAGRMVKLDISMAATYATGNTFTVAGDQTAVFTEDRGLRANCGVDGTKHVSVASASYDAGADTTTVTTNESSLTDNLEKVFYIAPCTIASYEWDSMENEINVTVNEAILTDDITTLYYGLRFASPSNGAISKIGYSSSPWQGRGLKGGSAASFRFYTNALETGEGTDKERFDGSCGISGDLQMVSTTIQIGAQSTIDNFKLTEPV